MPRFFVKNNQIDGGFVKIISNDAFHISRSLRMAKGEHITVCDENATEYDCALEEFLQDCVLAKIISENRSKAEPPFLAYIYQGLPKGDKLDTVIQKSVECGAYSVTTFESEFCVVKVKSDSENSKLERRNRIALEAAKQSGRAIVPKVNRTLSFDDMITDAKDKDFLLFCYEGKEAEPISRFVKDELGSFEAKNGRIPSVAIVIGPEGGFSLKEVEKAKLCGFNICSLGNRILRTETASTFALCCLIYETELSHG